MILGNEAVQALQENRENLPEAIVSYIFDFKKPKFLFDDLYHFSGRHYACHAAARNMLPVVKFMLTKVIERTMDQSSPLMLIPEAITNGRLYYDLAEKHEGRIRAVRDGHLTTYRMGEILNKGELANLTEKNKNRAMERLEGFQKLFPDAAVMSPTGMEAMLKTLMKESGFSNYQSLRDEDFEAFWIGVCFVSNMGGFADEVAYSRNGNFETFALFQKRYGLVPFAPKGDVDIVFPDRSLVRPVDYVHLLEEHARDVVPRGFTADLTMKMATRMMMLEDMRVNGLEHPQWGKLDMKAVNPALRDLPRAHDAEFADAKDRMLAFINEYDLLSNMGDLFGLDGYDGLGGYLERQIEKRGRVQAVAWEAGDGLPAPGTGGRLSMSRALDSTGLIDDVVLQIPYQHDGDFFCRKSPLFDEGHFERCEPVARIALKALVGLHEATKIPLAQSENEKGEAFIFIDRRGGMAGEAYARDHGVVMPDEARGLSASFAQNNFEEAVKTRNIAAAHDAAAALRAHAPQMGIVTSEDIERDAQNFCTNRQAFAAPGSGRMDGTAKTALAEELLLRHGKLALFDQHWENRPMTTWLRLHARKIQLGLVRRPVNRPLHMLQVGDVAHAAHGQKPYSVKTLADDIGVMSARMDRLVASGCEEYPRHLVKGLIECITFADLYYNDGLNHAAGKNGHGLIDWQSVPMGLKRGLDDMRDSFIPLKKHAKAQILAHGLNALSHDDVGGALALIDPDYERAKLLQGARQNKAKSKKPRGSGYQIDGGYNAARPR